MNRALRRHLSRRVTARRARNYAHWDIPYAHWMKHTGKKCSCCLCGNPRHLGFGETARLTPQEIRSIDSEADQLGDLIDSPHESSSAGPAGPGPEEPGPDLG